LETDEEADAIKEKIQLNNRRAAKLKRQSKQPNTRKPQQILNTSKDRDQQQTNINHPYQEATANSDSSDKTKEDLHKQERGRQNKIKPKDKRQIQ
jgi:hypothetical protein